MVKVLFDSRASFLDRQSRMHQYFELNPGMNVLPVSVFHDHISYQKYKHLKNTELLSLYWKEGSMKYSRKDLIEVEEKYCRINLWNIVASDRFISCWDENQIIKQISFYFSAWEDILEKHKPAYVVSETVTGLWNYSLYQICRQKNIKYLSVHTTKNTGRYYFSDDQYGSWREFDTRFAELLEKGLNESETKSALKFLEEIRSAKMVPPYMKFSSRLPDLTKFLNLPRFMINLKKDIDQNWLNKNHDYKLGYRVYDYKYSLIRYRRIIHAKLAKYFKPPDLAASYVLYPVHFQPEATTDIWAPFYSDQIYVIRSLARSLPFGYNLYVKEHSAMLGSKPIKFYREICKIPNVRLIDPWVSITALIKHSAAVATITSTTGLEAIFWNKPVIVFGKVFYDIFPGILRVNNIGELPDLLKLAIRQCNDGGNNKELLAFAYLYSKMGFISDIYSNTPAETDLRRFCDDLLKEIIPG